MALAVEFSTINEMFTRICSRFAKEERAALMYKTEGSYRRISYSQLKSLVENCAHGLASLPILRGDNIGLICESRPEWVVCDLAMLMLGAVNVPLYPTSTPKQIQFILNDAGITLVIVSNQLQLNKILTIIDSVPRLQRVILIVDKGSAADNRVLTYSRLLEVGEKFGRDHQDYLERASEKVRPDDLLTIIYTSGTTGNPKGVMLTHRNLVSNIHAAAQFIPISSDDVALSFLPLCHSFERMAGYYTVMSCGGTIAFAESIETIRDNLLEVKPTFMTTVPRLFERFQSRLMKQLERETMLRKKIFVWALEIGKRHALARRNHRIPFTLSLKHVLAEYLVYRKVKQKMGGRIRFFVSGAAALSRELGEFFEALGIRIIEGYGLTESSPAISVNRVDDYKFGTVGKPLPGVEVKIAEDGEILVHGPNIMKGYWKNPTDTEKAIDPHGWLRTGDIGRFDEDGFLVITDRKKHLFVSSGGKNIAPQPIENLFLQSNYIDQIVLIGDKRMFLSALIVPDFEAVGDFARANGVRFQTIAELLGKPEVYKFFEEEIGRIQRDLASYERIRKFTLLPSPLTIENGEITPTMKVRRKVVEERYRDLLERMYEGVD